MRPRCRAQARYRPSAYPRVPASDGSSDPSGFVPFRFDQYHRILAVDFLHQDANFLMDRCGDIFPYIICLDGELSMPPVDHDGKLNSRRSSQINELIESGTYCASCIKDVVHEDDVLTGHIERDDGSLEKRLLTPPSEIVAIERDIQKAELKLLVFQSLDLLDEASGEELPPRADAYNSDRLSALVVFQDFVRESVQCALESRLIDHA